MRIIGVILLALITWCHAQDTNLVTSKVFERDRNKDGRPDVRIETVYRGSERIMTTWSRAGTNGALKVSSRSFLVGGELITTEIDEDQDGLFETLVIYRAGTPEMDVFSRGRDGSVVPVSGTTLAAYMKQNAATDELFNKVFDKKTGTEEAMKMFRETQRKIQAAEREKEPERD